MTPIMHLPVYIDWQMACMIMGINHASIMTNHAGFAKFLIFL